VILVKKMKIYKEKRTRK